MTIESIKKIAVIGAGTMGQGIAQVCASAGYQVLLYDVQPELMKKAESAIEKSLQTSVEKGKITPAQKNSTLGCLNAVTNFQELHVDLVIEAVVEKLEIKQKLFRELEEINSTDCILASNTSSIPITQIASVLKHQHRVVGLHFFNPAPAIKLVEIIQGASTSQTTTDVLKAFVQKISKTAVLANDSPGFIVNRVARHFYVESLKVLEDGTADVEKIDKLLKATGFKMGPFELMDLIGIDINLSVTSSLYNAFHQDPKFRPSRIQQQKVDAGLLGRKSGKGFYSY